MSMSMFSSACAHNVIQGSQRWLRLIKPESLSRQQLADLSLATEPPNHGPQIAENSLANANKLAAAHLTSAHAQRRFAVNVD